MTDGRLTVLLAERVMGWTVGRDRFMTGSGGWMPRWRFQPTKKLDDAFRLLEEAAPREYSICGSTTGDVHVRVRIGASAGEATGRSMPRTIAIAIARAVGLDVPDDVVAAFVSDHGMRQVSRRRPHAE